MALVIGEQSATGVRTRPAGHAVRADIQGLRALAVGLVVCYHLRPEWLTGGFVGVDVFFVISGFLIIGTLTGEVRRTGRVGLLDFYARRIRRLLPAATAVLLATSAAVFLLLPHSRWPVVLREVVFSALNAQNWLLAVLSDDYGHATVGASPVQHFWSLAVEEQFYLVIPLVLLAAAALAARRGGGPVRYAVVAVAAITVASFAFSVWYTPVDHGAAYFVTPTRMWELGIGGLAAMVLHRLRPGRAARPLLAWGGLAAVLAGAVWFTTDMAFPGWVAALPTVGTVAMLVARDDSLAGVLGLRPLTYVGDISYSLYLWHWPVIVLLLEVTGDRALDRGQVVLAAALSLALAALSKHFVEDPFRRRKPDRKRTTYGIGAAMVAVSVAVAAGGWVVAESTLAALRTKSLIDAEHPGALALDPNRPLAVPAGVALAPAPAVAEADLPPDDCVVHDLNAQVKACAYGVDDAPRTVVVIGDSHAAQFSGALAEFVRHEGAGQWRVEMAARNGCPFSTVPPSDAGTPLTVCSEDNLRKLDAIRALKPDLVLVAAMSPESYRADLKWTWESSEHMVEGYRAVLSALSEADIPVAVIRELPRPAAPVAPCLERHPDRPTECDTPRGQAVGSTAPLAEAAAGLPGVRVVDLTDWICRADVCPGVVGNVVVYRNNHLTDTYVRSLTDPLVGILGLR